MKVAHSCPHLSSFETPWTIQSIEFSRPEYWNWEASSSPGDLPNPGIEPRSPTLQVNFLPAEPQKTPEIPKVLGALGQNRGEDYIYLLCCSVTQLCLTLCNPMDCSTPAFSFHHQLLELTQTRVHWVRDAIQPSHLLSSPSLHALSLSQHQDHLPKQMPSKNVSMLIIYVYLWKSKSG